MKFHQNLVKFHQMLLINNRLKNIKPEIRLPVALPTKVSKVMIQRHRRIAIQEISLCANYI